MRKSKTKMYLGTLCKHGHEFRNTGMSLRYKGGTCVECVKIQVREWREKQRQLIEKQREEYRLMEERANRRKERIRKLVERRTAELKEENERLKNQVWMAQKKFENERKALAIRVIEAVRWVQP